MTHTPRPPKTLKWKNVNRSLYLLNIGKYSFNISGVKLLQFVFIYLTNSPVTVVYACYCQCMN